MRWRAWELTVFVLGVLLSATFVAARAWHVALAVGCASLIWLVTRAEIPDAPDRAGNHARRRGQLGMVRVVLVAGVYAAVVWAGFVLRGEEQTQTVTIATFALIGLAFMLVRDFRSGADAAFNWLKGSDAEQRVGAQLDLLRDDGWLVVHGFRRDERRDVDHIVCGPTGLYVVETKSYGFSRRDVHQATGNAVWLKERVGARWVTGVLCVAGDLEPREEGRGWVVGATRLAGWLQTQSNQRMDPDVVRRRLLEG